MAHEDTVRRAVETINELLAAHVTTGPSDVDVHRAMAVRDDLRELEPTADYDVPEVGDVLNDPESPNVFGSGDVRVTEVTDVPAHEFTIPGLCRTVAQTNPDHPADAPVVAASYVDGSDKEYHFPVTRLE